MVGNAIASGRPIIRPARPEDAPGMLAVTRTIADEAVYFVVEPQEIRPEAQQRERIATRDHQEDEILVAEADGQIIGFLSVKRGQMARTRHTAQLGLGVLPAVRGQGVGRRLLEGAEAWARSVGVKKLCLGVFAMNEGARRLYERLGYEVEGVQKRQFLVQGHYVDDIIMGKWLDP